MTHSKQFYLRLYSIRHDVMDHLDNKTENQLLCGLFLQISRKHSYIHQEGRKEGNALFNDALNIFYLRLYGIGHMVKEHSS